MRQLLLIVFTLTVFDPITQGLTQGNSEHCFPDHPPYCKPPRR